MSNTICVSQEGPANALALSKDCSQVVIAGRNVFKVFSIDNEFNEVCNLRVGKNLNLNFSSIDVAWSTIEENTLATAATNGAVVVWNLSRSGRSKQEHVFSDHKRTVNKVSFHLTEPALLISGSQDGMMKCFDLRMKEVARTFLSNTESVRDVQFSPHSAHTFAAVSENGGVQLWDVRRAEKCLHQFTAHSGPVFACDWHPEYPWLATASRDKTIKVWDIHARPSLEYTIHTIASVGHVKWRPQRKYHIASCALVLDSSVNIWDVRRPCVPLATFDKHRDIITAIAWAGEPDVFLSTSRDCTLYRHTFRDAVHPAMAANPHGIGMGVRGDIALASAQHRAPPTPPSLADRLHTLIGRKHSTASSCAVTPTSTPSAAQVANQQQQQQLQLEATFHTSSTSNMRWWTATEGEEKGSGVAAFIACAKNYRIAGCLMSICEHNAAVAKENGKYQVSLVWLVIKTIYASKASSPKQESNAVPQQLLRDDNGLMQTTNLSGGLSGVVGATQGSGLSMQEMSGTSDASIVDNSDTNDRRLPRIDQKSIYSSFQLDDDNETDDGSDHQFHNSGVLGFPTQNIHIPRVSHACYNEDNRNWLTAGSAHYVDSTTQDWTLQGEAFILRSSVNPQHDGQSTNSSTFTEMESAMDNYESHNVTMLNGHLQQMHLGSVTSATSGVQTASSNSLSNSPTSILQATGNSGEDSLVCRYAVSSGGEAWASASHVAAALRLHAELGDVQTSVTVLLALGELRSTLSGHLDETTQEHWLVSYLDLLARHKLWDICTQIIQCAWLASISQLSQQSTTVHTSCGRCGRTLAPPMSPASSCSPSFGAATCERCGPPAPSTCSICHQVVRGLYAWCQGCSHGGHAAHIQDWLKENRQCPAGCGHICEYS